MSAPLVTTQGSGFKAKDPERFDGSPEKFKGFWIQLQLVTRLQPHHFTDETTKVLYASNLLQGKALTWFEPFLNSYFEQGDGAPRKIRELFGSLERFKEELSSFCGVRDQEKEAERKIHTIKQVTSVSHYAAQFRSIAVHLDWDDAALASVFYRGLREEVREQYINREKPTGLDRLIADATKLDNRIMEFKQEKVQRNFLPRGNPAAKRYPANVSKPRFYGGPMPMDLDNANKKRNYTKGPLSKAEKERRIKNSLCLYCGKPGHVANDCTAKKKKPFGKPKQLAMAEAATHEPTVTWADSASDPDHPEHLQLHWTGCYHDECLTHKADKDYGYYPKKPSKKANKVKQRSQTPMPTNRALRCADGPKAETMTMDGGRFEVTCLTSEAVHIKTHYYRVEWCNSRYCDQEAQHQHVWYDPTQPWAKIPALTKLLFCDVPTCPHQDPEEPHIHQGNDYRQRTLTVDKEPAENSVEPTIQMSDVNFPTCDLDAEGPWESDDTPEPEPEPEPYPYEEKPLRSWDDRPVVDETCEGRIASALFKCPRVQWKTCEYRRRPHGHTHRMHYDPRDMTRPIPKKATDTMCDENECELMACPYREVIGRHLHWTKNE